MASLLFNNGNYREGLQSVNYEIANLDKTTIISVCVCISNVSGVWGILPIKALQGGAHISCNWTAGHCRLTLSLDWENVRLPPSYLPTVGWHGCPLFTPLPNNSFPKTRKEIRTKKSRKWWERSSKTGYLSKTNASVVCLYKNSNSWGHPDSTQNIWANKERWNLDWDCH